MANEKRLIDANAIKYRTIGCGGWGQPEEVVDKYDIDRMHTVDAVEVVHGRWDDDGRCTRCGRYMPFDCEGNAYESIYCPDCGAVMTGR